MSLATLLAAVVAGVTTVGAPTLRTAPPRAAESIPVRLFLDQPRYAPGSEGQVRVQVGQDGYLVVLYANPDGHVSIAYPLDPGTSDRVNADTEIVILSRGGRAAFTVEDSSGSGTWYAAISELPFRLDQVAVNGHWDYRGVPRVENPNAVESELTDFVKGLARGRFDYDIVSYTIDTAAEVRTSSAGSAPPPVSPGAGGPISVPWIWRPVPWRGPAWVPPWPGPYYDRSLPNVVVVSHSMELARAPAEPEPTAPTTRPADAHGPRGEPRSAPRNGGGGSSGTRGSGKGKA
jgi:hypothetical protein